jgi:hypothetical protein
VLRSTPFGSASAAAAALQQQQQAEQLQQQQRDDQQPATATAVAGGSGRTQPELIGFILLDPLWEGGHEMGYVSSIVRMKRSAHQGGRGSLSMLQG